MKMILKCSKHALSLFTLLAYTATESIAALSQASDTTLLDIGATFITPKGFTLKNNTGRHEIKFDYDCRVNNVVPNAYPDFYYQNRDSSVLILIEYFRNPRKEPNPLIPYHLDANYTIFYESAVYADTANNKLTFYNTNDIAPSNADKIVEFTQKCNLINTDFRSRRSRYYLQFDNVYIRVSYLSRSNVTDIEQIVENTRDLVYFINDLPNRPRPTEFDRHYTALDPRILNRMIPTTWNRGTVYNNLYYFAGEAAAFQFEEGIVNIQYPVNKTWPFFNAMDGITAQDKENWDIANNDFKNYLRLAKGQSVKCSKKQTKKLNADEAYIFDFSHEEGDLYRKEYRHCKVLLCHKKNIGTMIVKYYYKEGLSQNADRLMKSTWSLIKFQDAKFFDTLNRKVYPY